MVPRVRSVFRYGAICETRREDDLARVARAVEQHGASHGDYASELTASEVNFLARLLQLLRIQVWIQCRVVVHFELTVGLVSFSTCLNVV